MFDRAKSKLEDAHLNLASMRKATTAPQFRAAFNSFLSNCRAVTYALQKEGASLDGFSEWYASKQMEMKEDELLRFIHKSRTEDFHEGQHCLRFSTYVDHLSSTAVGPPPKPGASLTIGPEGPFWLVDQGTARECRIPVTRGSWHVVQVDIENPPAQHKGKPMAARDPITLCQAAADYMAEVVHEARTKFSGSA
jgi:hypothetical protein